MPDYRVFVRDGSRQVVDELDAWLSCSLVLRFNGVSTGELELARQMPGADLLRSAGGVIVQRDGSTIFSGRATTRTRTATTLSVVLDGDERVLRTAVRPTPALAVGPYPDADYVLTGTPSTVMMTLVDQTIGPSAPAAWHAAGLVMGEDHGLGSGTGTLRARLDPLLVLLQSFSASPQAGGLRFWIAQDDPGSTALRFHISSVRDRRQDAVFSVESETAADYEDTEETGGANYVYVLGGDGFGVARTILEAGDADAILKAGERVTTVLDHRGTADTGELQQRLAEALAEVGTPRRVTIVPQEVPSLTYGEEYDLGDIVTVVIDGEPFVEVIREVAIDLTPDRGAVVTPTVHGDGASADDSTTEGRIARHILAVSERVGYLERYPGIPDDAVSNAMLAPSEKWSVGDIKLALRNTVQTGWLLMSGQSVLKASFPELWAHFQTEGLAFGSDATTFVIPTMQELMPLGNITPTSLGGAGGAASVVLPGHSHAGPAHTHPGAHSHGMTHFHASQAHDHPGPHSHGLQAHRHQMGHDHQVNGNPTSTSTRADGANAVGSSTHGHGTTSNSNNTITGSGERTADAAAFTTTDADSNAPGANYSGSPTGPQPSDTTNPDSNAHAASAGSTGSSSDVTVGTMPPFRRLNYYIRAVA